MFHWFNGAYGWAAIWGRLRWGLLGTELDGRHYVVKIVVARYMITLSCIVAAPRRTLPLLILGFLIALRSLSPSGTHSATIIPLPAFMKRFVIWSNYHFLLRSRAAWACTPSRLAYDLLEVARSDTLLVFLHVDNVHDIWLRYILIGVLSHITALPTRCHLLRLLTSIFKSHSKGLLNKLIESLIIFTYDLNLIPYL